eukprot:TRINITY_DN7484_c0_g1_i2.p1 TRINITY_DN7484_c0_g1~~TRINITY_DN7484_c0_g1_i2.p1  ORF type:complete len:226 (+),score=46.02 TRINITY_DN7484_c0_g1_i2:273-950(+)
MSNKNQTSGENKRGRFGQKNKQDHGSHSSSNSKQNDSDGSDDSSIRCVCEKDEDYGLMVQCDQCSRWQHCQCFGINSQRDIPDEFFCHLCQAKQLKEAEQEASKFVSIIQGQCKAFKGDLEAILFNLEKHECSFLMGLNQQQKEVLVKQLSSLLHIKEEAVKQRFLDLAASLCPTGNSNSSKDEESDPNQGWTMIQENIYHEFDKDISDQKQKLKEKLQSTQDTK